MRRIFKEDSLWSRFYLTTLELVVIIMIVFVLVAIAIPDFLTFSTPDKRTRASLNLQSIFTAQVEYFGEHNTYAGGQNCFELLGWEPTWLSCHNYRCGDDLYAANMQWSTTVTECAHVEPATSRHDFTACAVGNIDRDDDLDVWSISLSKDLEHVFDDVGGPQEKVRAQ